MQTGPDSVLISSRMAHARADITPETPYLNPVCDNYTSGISHSHDSRRIVFTQYQNYKLYGCSHEPYLLSDSAWSGWPGLPVRLSVSNGARQDVWHFAMN